jgi:DNA mismatch repair protein MutS
MKSYLKIDEQTLSDLSIFGKSGKASIYDLYNKTKTQGGAKKLKALFNQPLANRDAINAQAEIFRFFSLKEYVFPVDSDSMGALSYYLENNDVRSQLQVSGQSFGDKLKGLVAAEAEQVFVKEGVQAALRLFYKVQVFVAELESLEFKVAAYKAKFELLKGLINSQDFAAIKDHCRADFEVKLSQIVLADLDKKLRFEQREKTLQLLEVLYELDVYISIGQLARTKGYSFAKALPKSAGTLHYKQVYHPQVAAAIANNLEMNTAHNILFLTGANMAGKSTLMKSIGIALYLGHMGFPVAAESFEFSVRDGIYTSINLADNLSQGASHYYAEVLRVKEVAIALSQGKELFVIFDELFRGTNVKDAYDATIALTRAFTTKAKSQFIISTHIMEAGEVLQKENLPIQYQYLPTEMRGIIPVYTRVLKEGITADRQGMVIIRNEGILEMLDEGLKRMEA